MRFTARLAAASLALFAAFGPMTTAQAAAGSGIGLGPFIGKPVGISAKIWQGRTNAIDCLLGWSLSGNSIYGVADYVWHNYNLIPVSSGSFPLYYGLGVGVGISNNPGVGLRIPVGLEYLLASAPLDFFLEIAPIAVIFPDPGIDLNAGLGARYFF